MPTTSFSLMFFSINLSLVKVFVFSSVKQSIAERVTLFIINFFTFLILFWPQNMHFRLSTLQINKVKPLVSLMTTFVPLFNRKPCDCHFHPFIHGLTCHLSYLHTLTWEKGTRRSSLCPSFQPHFMIIALWILSIHDKQCLVFLATHAFHITKLGKSDFFGGVNEYLE